MGWGVGKKKNSHETRFFSFSEMQRTFHFLDNIKIDFDREAVSGMSPSVVVVYRKQNFTKPISTKTN